MRTIFCSLFFIGVFLVGKAQEVNEYKYVVVPDTYDFAKRENQYQINELTEFLFEKFGFEAFLESEQKPEDLMENGCLALYADVKDDSGLFVTKMTVLLKDCRGNLVFESKEGRSREKEFKKAWHASLRDAFTSIDSLDYKYEADSPTELSDVSEAEVEEADEVESLEDENSEEAEVAEEVPVQEPVKEEEKFAVENSTAERYFVKDNAVYYLEETPNGFSFYQKGMAEPFAVLVRSEMGEAFIYNSMTKQGMAYFDENANLIVEYFDRNQNETLKTIYKVLDQ